MALPRQLLGGTDFLGQETVWFGKEPVWAENYYGYVIRPDLIDAKLDWSGPHGHYQDRSSGTLTHFHGREVILVSDIEAYALDYCGGLIKP